MKTANDYTGHPTNQRPTPHSLVTMEACKTCSRADPTSGGGFFCLLRCKPCRVPESSKDDDCISYIENKNGIVVAF